MDAGARLENAWANSGSVGSNPTSFATINRNLVPLKEMHVGNQVCKVTLNGVDFLLVGVEGVTKLPDIGGTTLPEKLINHIVFFAGSIENLGTLENEDTGIEEEKQ